MSLRSRLILSHVAVIVITLIIVGVSLVYILRGLQRQIQLARLGDALVPLAFQARTMFADGLTVRQALDQLEAEAGTVGQVIVITDKGLVIGDPSGNLIDRTVKLIPLNSTNPRDFYWGAHNLRTKTAERTMLFAAIGVGTVNGQSLYVGLSAVERSIGTVLAEIIPSLVIAGGATLFLLLLVALVLARTIAKPITRLTHATEAVAAGNYTYRVDRTGRDEIGRLAASFNSMAERVQQSRQMEKDFVANVSHELKTPLTSIQGFSQAILDGAVQDLTGAQRVARTIYEETMRMSHLVADLLTIARFESGEMPLARESLDLNRLLPGWVERLEPQARLLGEQLVTLVEPLPPVNGDASRLEEVIVNLVDNALKYNRPGGSVTVTARSPFPDVIAKSSGITRRWTASAPGKRWVTISVADTGSGISPQDLPRVFERFYRGDKARAAGGTGLGLSIAHEIVIAHGGKLTVTSEAGHGSTFTVLLPAGT